MRLAIMQPYFLPYIGYFQLIHSANLFIVYDNIKYTKKGWINRNRILLERTDKLFSLPLKKNSDFLDVAAREISSDFKPNKLLNQFRYAYCNAPNFSQVFPVLEKIIYYKDRNLFKFIYHSLLVICQYLNISTEIKVSSNIAIDHKLKNQDKVIALCKAVMATTYINTAGGMGLYDKNHFNNNGLELKLIKPKYFEYKQFDNDFIPWLSIIDIMMFVPLDIIHDRILNNYELI